MLKQTLGKGLLMRRAFLLALLIAGPATPAAASTIAFEDRLGLPFFFEAGAPQHLLYNVDGVDVTFDGGVILTNESNQVSDLSSVYATGSWKLPDLANIDHGFINPLLITFSEPIHNFELDILNARAGDYELFDNIGNSVTFHLATTGNLVMTEGFAAAGSEVRVQYLTDPGAWDFAVDNIHFNQPLTIVPEPVTGALVATGLMAAAVRRRRRYPNQTRNA